MNVARPDATPSAADVAFVPDDALVRRSVDLALINVDQGGKPFACIVVDTESGDVLTEATNQVAQSGDVTAHAEITAIRALAESGRADLTGCDVYVTAYPCPMCLGALYYAAPERVVFAVTRAEEAEHYEDGGRYMSLTTFYDQFVLDPDERTLPATPGRAADADWDATAPFRRWSAQHAE